MEVPLVLMDLPHSVRGGIKVLEDGRHAIIVNARLNTALQKKAYLHELRHIKNGDYDNFKRIGVVEMLAHQIRKVKK